MAIFAIVLLNALMGYIQQARAEQAVATLRQMSAAEANVVRDGERRSIPTTEFVPGDVILVEEGDTVPADARLIESTALQTAEAARVRACRCQKISPRSRKRWDSATGTTWSSAARRRPMGAGPRWSRRPGCEPRWGALRGC
jgi:type II secretory pathway pseudopilin PulG